MLAAPVGNPGPARHAALVRLTHWITAACFLALLVSGVEIVISHPRFYWGETGNALTPALFQIPIPASRGTVPTGYDVVLSDQNGWSRYLHFQTAWALVITGLVYTIYGFSTSHFQYALWPAPADRNWQAIRAVMQKPFRHAPTNDSSAANYNALQRITYLVVIFILFPFVIWTGLAMSPAFNAAIPAAVNSLGGRQSARTLHLFVSAALLLFLFVHVAMVVLAGFKPRMRTMITGLAPLPQTDRPGSPS